MNHPCFGGNPITGVDGFVELQGGTILWLEVCTQMLIEIF